ncbi:putative vegetative incompatibility protein 4 [Phaeomoniella chlamydospora]|uniref:protein-ribulosamine 3-kinase n=1 Tax=Phaeomoniella chlamydospora TaxID=158046 RepID=A0A0G2E589_PHACM|nr:putative vegetative incompatibility protein 4 [Phaeomoniella chlamydospora]
MTSSVQTLLSDAQPERPLTREDFPVDDNVMAKFPEGTRVVSSTKYGNSAWTVTARLRVELPDGTQARYFVKTSTVATGRLMMEGEFNSMSELYKWMPNFVPKPHSWGKYKVTEPETYFFICEYLDMIDRMPDPSDLCSKVAQLHRISTSPDGRFGFHVSTCQGQTPQAVGWEDTWTALFTKLLHHVVDIDMETNGYWEGLDQLEKKIFSHVIPLLIGNLERDGRSVKPCLIHADLWEGNIGTLYDNGNLVIFDAGAYYAHNEMETGDWRCYYNKIHSSTYGKVYKRYYRPSEPREEWEDRNRMYCVYYNVMYSCNHKARGKPVRQAAYNDMYFLVNKYAPFPKGEGPPAPTEEDYQLQASQLSHVLPRESGVPE